MWGGGGELEIDEQGSGMRNGTQVVGGKTKKPGKKGRGAKAFTRKRGNGVEG